MSPSSATMSSLVRGLVMREDIVVVMDGVDIAYRRAVSPVLFWRLGRSLG